MRRMGHPHPDGCKAMGRRTLDWKVWGIDGPTGIMVEIGGTAGSVWTPPSRCVQSYMRTSLEKPFSS